MGEKSYELGSGQIFINNERLASVDRVTFTTEVEQMNNQMPIICVDRAREASFTGRMIVGRANGKTLLQTWHTLLGILAELKRLCRNKRVVHLAFNGKTYRVRKKNYKRMLKIIEKQEKKTND